jgi:hypothetical protein
MSMALIILVSVCLIAGCIPSTVSTYPAKTEVGRPIDVGKYNQVIEGKTTEADLLSFMGEPSSIIERGNAKVMQYTHMITQTTGSVASSTGVTGFSDFTMMMFKIQYGVVVKKARMVRRQPIGIQPETTVITPKKQ